MKPLPTQKRALEKMTALIEAAQTSFADEGYEGTTAKSIADKAKVATGTFYQYFDNKDDILRVIAQKQRDEIYGAIPELTIPSAPSANLSTTTLFREVLELIYNYHESEAQLHQVLEQRRFNDTELDTILLRAENLMEDKVRQFVKTFNKENPDTVAYNLFAMAEGLVHRHVFGKPDTDKKEILDLGAKMLACYFE